jgi:hypothetical protein
MKVIDADEAFEADVFLLARWKDSRLIGEGVRRVPLGSVWAPDILIFNRRDTSRDLPEVVTIQPDGTVVYRQRITGTFASRLDLRSFPLDSQVLQIRLVAYGTNTSEVVLIEHAEIGVARNSDLAISSWKVGPSSVESGGFEAIPGAPSLPALTVSMEVERETGYYIVQLLVPLLLIVGMSWVVFLIHPKFIPPRVGTCVYLTLVDHILLGATLLVAASLVTVAVSSRMVDDRLETAHQINRIARVLHPILFILLLIVVRFGT